MERTVLGLSRPKCMSRYGKAASACVPSPASYLENALFPSKLPTVTDRKSSLSPSFLSISREQAIYQSRNRTESPSPGHYHPNYDVSRLRTDSCPVYDRSTALKRPQRLHVPVCMTHINTSYPRHKRSETVPLVGLDGMMKRVTVDLGEFTRTVEREESRYVGGEKGEAGGKGLVAMDVQLDRKDVAVKQTRCEIGRTIPVVASHQPIPDFSKSTQRKELFQPRPLPDYRPQTHLTRRRSPQPLSFTQRPGRKGLALSHMMTTPPQINLNQLEKGWKALESQKGKNFRLETMSPRDDIMYRTNGEYVRNRPSRKHSVSKTMENKVTETQTSVTFYL